MSSDAFVQNLIMHVQLAEEADLCEALQRREDMQYRATRLKNGQRKVVLYFKKKPEERRKRSAPPPRVGLGERKRPRRGSIDHGF